MNNIFSALKDLKTMLIMGIFMIIISPNNAGAQTYKLNFGLSVAQDTATIPKSKVAVKMPERKKKQKPNTILKEISNGEWLISKGWELIAANQLKSTGEDISNLNFKSNSWLNATVPGTVLTTLVDQGVYPDPYFGLNNLAIPDSLARMDWWYRTTFKVTQQQAQMKDSWLIFKGINYQAEIFLNGKKLGKIKGAFTKGEFNVKGLLKEGDKNVIAVHILPVNNPGIPHEESPLAGTGPNGGVLALDGPTFISSEGWDWVPGIRDRNIGIWQDVSIKFVDELTIKSTQVITDLNLPDTTQAKLIVRAEVFNASKNVKQGILKGEIGNVSFTKNIQVEPGKSLTVSFTPEEYKQLVFNNPRLWWPNGYGKQEFYHLNLTVSVANGATSDHQEVRFGIREFSYDMTIDMPNASAQRIDHNPITDLAGGKPLFDNINRREVIEGVWVPRLRANIPTERIKKIETDAVSPYLVVKVNGVPIFCKGGNWGMDDGMKRSSRKNLEPYFKLHNDAGFNMIRNWTGESTQASFYELADEYGMLVWNDFWISTEGYNLYPQDNELFMRNAEDVIKKFRNHPSIVIWCARNEGPPQEVIENGLANFIAKEDGTRLYQPNSRNLNLRPSGPWHYLSDPTVYYSKIAKGFSTELGTPAVPTATSIRKMMSPEDTWPIGDVWYYHDLHDGQKGYRNAIDSLYGVPTDLDDFCKKAQLINYESHRAMFEAWNSKQWNSTTGLLLWMTHPAWPSTVWQVYSWDYETFGAYFGAKKGCEPIHIQMNLDDKKVVVANTSLRKIVKATASLVMYDLEGNEKYRKQQVLDITANQLTNCFPSDIPSMKEGVYIVRLLLKDGRGNLVSENDYWHNTTKEQNYNDLNRLAEVTLGSTIKWDTQNNGKVLITNPSAITAVAVKLNAVDLTTNQIILPAYFSEGYFNLLPGERKEVNLTIPDGILNDKIKIAPDGYNVVRTEFLTKQTFAKEK